MRKVKCVKSIYAYLDIKTNPFKINTWVNVTGKILTVQILYLIIHSVDIKKR